MFEVTGSKEGQGAVKIAAGDWWICVGLVQLQKTYKKLQFRQKKSKETYKQTVKEIFPAPPVKDKTKPKPKPKKSESIEAPEDETGGVGLPESEEKEEKDLEEKQAEVSSTSISREKVQISLQKTHYGQTDTIFYIFNRNA